MSFATSSFATFWGESPPCGSGQRLRSAGVRSLCMASTKSTALRNEKTTHLNRNVSRMCSRPNFGFLARMIGRTALRRIDSSVFLLLLAQTYPLPLTSDEALT